MSDRHVTKITPEARQRCATHTLQDQLAMLREIERRKIIDESCERIMRDDDEMHHNRLILPLEGAD